MAKNVLINYLGANGAGDVCSYSWAQGFQKNGCNVYAVLSNRISNKNLWEQEFPKENLVFLDTHRGYKEFLIKTIRFYMRDRFVIRSAFKNVSFDFSFRLLYGRWCNIVEKTIKNNKKVVTICHDPELHSGEKLSIRLFYKNYITISDDIFVLTRSFIPVAHKNYGIDIDRIHYVPHGRMNAYKKCQNTEVNYHYSPENVNFVFFGRISKYKGLHVLAKAYKMLREKYQNVTLTVAGNGDFSEYKEEYKKLEGVTVLNRFIPDEEVGGLFDGPNIITVVPYTDATQSGVIPIAMEYGTPVIASDAGGLKEQLDDGKTGWFFTPEKAEELAERMAFCVENPEECIKQAGNMRRCIEKRNWDVVAKQVIDALE